MPAQTPQSASGSAPSRQLTLTHFGHGVKRAHSGSSRLKTPMRAQKILRRMEEGFEKGKRKEEDERLKAAGAEAPKRPQDGGDGGDRGPQATEASSTSQAAVEETGKDSAAPSPPTNASLALKRPYRPRPGSRPRQRYLTGSNAPVTETSPDPSSESAPTSCSEPLQEACNDGKDMTRCATATNSSESSAPAPRPAVPPVPIFSASARKRIHSLTSKSALKDSSNPITHSTTGQGTMHYQSASTGHQQANRVTASGRGPFSSSGQWWASRMTKIRAQLEDSAKVGAAPVASAAPTSESSSKDASEAGSTDSSLTSSAPSPTSNIFHGCRVYINGYVGTKVGNKELMRLLVQHGAGVDYLPNGGTTHIVSEMELSAKKREEMLSMKRLGLVKRFVRVDWILDSIEAARRKPEHLYAHAIPIQRGVADMLSRTSSDAKGDDTDTNRKPASTPLLVRTAQSSTPASSTSSTKSSKATSASTQDWRVEARRLAADAARRGKPKGCSG